MADRRHVPDDIAALLRTPFDPLLSDPTRLRIQAALVGLPRDGSMRFTALASTLGLSDGNLGTHLATLVEHGYVDTSVTMRGKRRTTWYAATASGRTAFADHVAALRAVVTATEPEVR
ncbi:transcriptional regulator [Nigerium massiliense]|uniref:transcriptional regulator n=1 Tax=Nigerium massiliense TaxID=1522317 RepID=UPI0006949AB8|nr:transcriptional regulator [Nigerium massiliense]